MEPLLSTRSSKNSRCKGRFRHPIAPKQLHVSRLGFACEEIRQYTDIATHNTWTIGMRCTPK
jgi:hypothetical protein